ncbi:MAG: response regulator transcription factor [Methylococcales bacterium]
MRVLIVEDERVLCHQIKEFFLGKGFAVEAALTGEEGYYFGSEFPIDAALIDLGLPDISGMELIQRLRSNQFTFPILILTARNRWQDKVEGLDAGADDYLVKPFHYEEMWARINALIRRSAGHSHPTIKLGNIEIDTVAQEVSVDSNKLDLTAYEYKVLEYLALHEGRVISKTALTDHLYAQDFDRDSNVIEVFVGRLRKKLDPEGILHPIETLRGRGYRFSTKEPDTK